MFFQHIARQTAEAGQTHSYSIPGSRSRLKAASSVGRTEGQLGRVTRCVFFAVVAISWVESRADDERPNVIVVLTDDQGFGDVGFNGNPHVRTPHLDRFAGEGTQFTRFYCSPVCAPTRASLLTGRYFLRTGVIHTSRGGAKMHHDEETLAELLRSTGYRTGIFGKWHLGDNYPMRPQDQGFEKSLIHKSGGIGQSPDQPNSYHDSRLWQNGHAVQADGYCTDVFFSAANDFIRRHRDEPFFVYLPTNAPHTPLEVDEKLVRPYLEKGLNEATARVYAMVENIDHNFGRLRETLKTLNLDRKTIVIFLGDNGPQQSRFNAGLRGRKSSVFEGGIRVPCVWHWPGKWKSGRQINAHAAHIDLVPTVLDLCGVEPDSPRQIDGISLRNWLENTAPTESSRALFFQVHRGLVPHQFHNSAVVTQRYKLVVNPDTFSLETEPPRPDRVMLFDLLADRAESSNIAAQHPEIVQQLQSQYLDWFQSVRSTRNFEPGRIVLGHSSANPVHLCRYQDGQFKDGRSEGWPVRVVTDGIYELQMQHEPAARPGTIEVLWNGEVWKRDVSRTDETIQVPLKAGERLLQVLFYPAGADKPLQSSVNTTDGDVEIRWFREL